MARFLCGLDDHLKKQSHRPVGDINIVCSRRLHFSAKYIDIQKKSNFLKLLNVSLARAILFYKDQFFNKRTERACVKTSARRQLQ